MWFIGGGLSVAHRIESLVSEHHSAFSRFYLQMYYKCVTGAKKSSFPNSGSGKLGHWVDAELFLGEPLFF